MVLVLLVWCSTSPAARSTGAPFAWRPVLVASVAHQRRRSFQLSKPIPDHLPRLNYVARSMTRARPCWRFAWTAPRCVLTSVPAPTRMQVADKAIPTQTVLGGRGWEALSSQPFCLRQVLAVVPPAQTPGPRLRPLPAGLNARLLHAQTKAQAFGCWGSWESMDHSSIDVLQRCLLATI